MPRPLSAKAMLTARTATTFAMAAHCQPRLMEPCPSSCSQESMGKGVFGILNYKAVPCCRRPRHAWVHMAVGERCPTHRTEPVAMAPPHVSR